MSSIIYIDEELPEITIREVISTDELLNVAGDKIGVNIHSTTDLFDQIMILLQKMKTESVIPLRRKVEGFLQVHQMLFEPTVTELPRSIVPKVSIQRKDVSITDPFFERYDQAIKIGNYALRREALDKAFLNLESIDTTHLPQWSPSEQANRPHEIELETEDRSIVLPKDKLHGTIKKLYTYKGVHTDSKAFQQYKLNDKISSNRKPWQEHTVTNSTYEEQVKSLIHPPLNDSLKEYTDMMDLYGLWKHFIMYGIDLDTYNEQEWKQLIEHLETLKQKDKDVFEFLKPLEYTPKALEIREVGGYTFYLVQQDIVRRILPIVSQLQTRLLELYQIFLDVTPMVKIDLNHLPKTAYELLSNIAEQKLDLSQTVDLLKIAVLSQRLKDLGTWMQTVQKWNIDETLIDKQVTSYQKTLSSIKNEPHIPFLSLTAELKDIKRGSLISYEVDERERRSDQALEVSMEEMLLEKEDPDEIVLPVYEDALPMDLTALDESQKEIQEPALRMIIELQTASGLPLDIDKTYQQLSPILRLSNISKLKALLPGLNDNIYTALNEPDWESMDAMIEATVPPTMYQTTKQALLQVQKEFIEEIAQFYNAFITLWICDLQQRVLNRTFHFDIWRGSLNCIQVWSPYGIPMEGLKIKKEGIVNYLLCIIHDLTLTEGTYWNRFALKQLRDDILAKWIERFETDLQTVVAVLQTQFKSFEKEVVNRGLLEKGEDIKKKIIETVEQRQKNRYLLDYMQFLKNLPSVLIQSSIAKKIHLGCCLQALNDRYRSDYDWAHMVKEAYRIKKLYATQRFGTDERPILTKILQTYTPQEILKLTKPDDTTILYDKLEPVQVSSMYEKIKPFIPVSDYNILQSGLRNIIPLIEKYIRSYEYTLKISSKLEELLNNFTMNDLLQMHRKIVQIQYLLIKTLVFSKEDTNYLFETFDALQPLHYEIYAISGYFKEVQEQNLRRLLQYFIARQICFPTNPEFSQGNVLILKNITVSADLLKTFLGNFHKELEVWLQQKQFNRQVDFAEYLAKEREQENLQKLRIIDQMNPEERRLYVDAKKLGIDELREYLERYKEKQENIEWYEENHDPIERDGEEETYPKDGENADQQDLDKFYDDNDY
uniref:Uncharacterized protein n=1 Tax=viral metagenome TaxID=1070528 RepID=A0A6C0CTC0_9ZZZZ